MIELREVCKRYTTGGRHVVALDGAELRVGAGEAVVVSGLSGAGKTTLIKLLYAAEFADAGVAKVFGHDIRRLRMSSIGLLRRRIGVVPQSLDLLCDRSALDNVALPLEVRAHNRKVARIRAAEVLGSCGMAPAADALVIQLSVGEQQRVAIARALVTEPSLLLLDEPTAHLDAVATAGLLGLLDAQLERKATLLVVSNDPRLLDAAATRGWRRLELSDGKLSAAIEVEAPVGELAEEDEYQVEVDASGEISTDEVEPHPNVVPFPRVARAGGVE